MVSLASRAAPWARPVAGALVVEVIVLAGTVFGPHRLQVRPLDALGVALLVAAAGTVAFASRRRSASLAAAIAATAGYYGLGYPTDSSFFVGLVVTAYLSGVAGARLRAGLFALAIVAFFVALAPFSAGHSITSGLPLALLAAAALAAGQVAAEWRARAERQAREVRQEEAMRMVAGERLRIARELHDVVSHSIAMINVQAGVAVHVMDQQPEQAREALVAIRAASRDAMRDLRGILGLLRSTDEAEPREPMVGLDHLPDLVESIRRAGVDVRIGGPGDGPPLPTAVDLTAYRVVQEALTNVVRHAPGAAASVSVRRDSAELVVEVVDDGGRQAASGGEARQGAGHGLVGMRERVRAAGGSLEVGPRPLRGYAVRARLPLPEAPA